jgi:hypothetical protein
MAVDVCDPDVERELSAVLDDSIKSLGGLREMSRGIVSQQLARSGLAAAMAAHLAQAGHAGALVVDEPVDAMRFDRRSRQQLFSLSSRLFAGCSRRSTYDWVFGTVA